VNSDENRRRFSSIINNIKAKTDEKREKKIQAKLRFAYIIERKTSESREN